MYKCLTKQWIEGDILAKQGERLTMRMPEKDRRLIDSFLEKEGKELKKLKTDLLTNICKIMLKVEHGSPLNGECDFCPPL